MRNKGHLHKDNNQEAQNIWSLIYGLSHSTCSGFQLSIQFLLKINSSSMDNLSAQSPYPPPWPSNAQCPFSSFVSWHSQNETAPRTTEGAADGPWDPLNLSHGEVYRGQPAHSNLEKSRGKGKCCVSAWRHSQLCLYVLVHHIADADGRDDFEEVGCKAPVESCGALGLQDLPEEPPHCHLCAALCCSYKSEKNDLGLCTVIFIIWGYISVPPSFNKSSFKNFYTSTWIKFLREAIVEMKNGQLYIGCRQTTSLNICSPCACMRVRTRASG